MTRISWPRLCPRSLTAALALIVILAAAGCRGNRAVTTLGGDKPVASVNGENISEAQFLHRVQNVTAWNLAPALEQQPGGRIPGKAGEYAMQALIAETMMLQLAREKNVLPTEEQVTKYVEFARKYQSPQVTLVPQDPYRNEEDWRRDARSTLAFRNLVMSRVKLNEADLKKDYEQYKQQLTEQDTYHLRLIDSRSEAKIKEALKALESDVAFETVALKYSEDANSGPKGGDVGKVPASYLQNNVPALFKEVQKIKPGEHTATYVKQAVPTGQPAPGQQQPAMETHYYIAQLVEKIQGKTPTFEEARLLLENRRMGQDNPSAYQQAQRDLIDFQSKARIEVFLKPYQELPQRLKSSASHDHGATAPAPAAQPPAATPPAAGAR